MKAKWLINPFERVAGWQALVIGVAVMALTAVIGKLNQVAFDGVLDVHGGATFNLSASFIMQAVNFLALFLTMWLAGVCFSKTKFRAIDMAGTMALARTPMLLLAIVCFLPAVPKTFLDVPRLIIFTLICIPFIIWMIALMYNAYSVSCHLKGSRAVVSFIGALLVAEIISKVIFFLLASHLFIASGNLQHTAIETSTPQEQIIIPQGQTIQQTAAIVIDALKKSDAKTVRAYFDETMKKASSEAQMDTVWASVILLKGELKSADTNVEATRYGEYDILLIPCTFERGSLNIQLAFNHEGKISGLYFK